jgi:GT2 family glycosyltransferase
VDQVRFRYITLVAGSLLQDNIKYLHYYHSSSSLETNSMKIAVLMACHNRRAKTIPCLKRLATAAEKAAVRYRLFIFDDGSVDGTADVVRAQEPDAVILTGDGTFFWNRSMNRAFESAMQEGFPAYLWLNDDTMLEPDAITQVLAAYHSVDEEVMVVGAVRDPDKGQMTYGGNRRVAPYLRPFLYVQMEPNGTPQDVDVVNGNVLFVPDAIARALGNLDPVFEHGMGDTDYSMRARKRGLRILQTAGYVGSCSHNPQTGTHKDGTLGMSRRLWHVFSRKGLPWRSWLTMCWRHGGMLWPVHFIWAYIKVILGRTW